MSDPQLIEKASEVAKHSSGLLAKNLSEKVVNAVRAGELPSEFGPPQVQMLIRALMQSYRDVAWNEGTKQFTQEQHQRFLELVRASLAEVEGSEQSPKQVLQNTYGALRAAAEKLTHGDAKKAETAHESYSEGNDTVSLERSLRPGADISEQASQTDTSNRSASPSHLRGDGRAAESDKFLKDIVFRDDVIVDSDPRQASSIKIQIRNGRTLLQWEAAKDGEQYLYRILAGNDIYSLPEPLEYLQDWGATEKSFFTHEQELENLVNIVAVWRYRYNSETMEVEDIPQLHAKVQFVSPPTAVHAHPASGQITLSWNPMEGEGQTLIFAFQENTAQKRALQQGAEVITTNYAANLIAQVPTRMGTYAHVGLKEDQHYYYLLLNQSNLLDAEGEEVLSYSSLAKASSIIPATLRPAELEAHSKIDENGSYISASYKKVPGKTALYFTENAPDPNLHQQSVRSEHLNEEILEQLGLPAAARQSDPGVPSEDGTTINFARLGWPVDTVELFITPVSTGADGTIMVGKTVQVQRVGEIKDLSFAQRITWQQLSFQWPKGADFVNLYVCAKGAKPDLSGNVPPQVQVHREAYKAAGRIELRLSTTCSYDIYLVGSNTFKGVNYFGPVSKISTPAIFPFSYGFKEVKKSNNMFGRIFNHGETAYEVRVRYDGDKNHPMPVFSCQILLSDRSFIAPIPYFNYGRCYPIPLKQSLYKEDTAQYQQVRLPKLASGQSALLGYIILPYELDYDAFARLKMVPVGLSYEALQQVAMRRRWADQIPVAGVK